MFFFFIFIFFSCVLFFTSYGDWFVAFHGVLKFKSRVGDEA
jgi:hypothetical protein